MTKELLLEVVKNYKEENGYSIKLCSDVIGVDERQLGYYLRGKRQMTDRDAELIAKFFGEKYTPREAPIIEKTTKGRIKTTAKDLNLITIGISFEAPLRLYYKMLDESEELGFSDMSKYIRQHFLSYFSGELTAKEAEDVDK